MNNTYYLKYRPKVIDELDIKDVRESLSKIVKSGKIPHAFLFAGPKGTGKTSAARILAKVVNCKKPKSKGVPCDKCDQCKSIVNGSNIDVIELDAASNRGIDDIRALREAVKLSPARAKKKVYIIDEAHMLTLEASNALLKTLEEPPDHVLFILATTNPEKLTDTIRSRTTNIVFRKAKKEEVTESLQRIIKGEKIKIEKKSLDIISQKAKGSFRDAAKILEQLVTEKVSFKEDKLKRYLNLSFETDIEAFVDGLSQKDIKKLIDIIEGSIESGVLISEFMESLMGFLRQGLLEKVGVGEEKIESLTKHELIEIIDLFSKAEDFMKTASIEQLPLEIVLIKWCSKSEGKDKKDIGFIERPEEEKKEAKKEGGEKNAMIDEKVGEQKKEFGGNDILKTSKDNNVTEVDDERWKVILTRLKPINSTIEALLRATRPICIEGNVLKLGVFYKFHKERLEEMKNRKIFEDVVTKIFGKPIRLVCTLTEPPKKKVEDTFQRVEKVLTEDEDKDIIKVAEEIFSAN